MAFITNKDTKIKWEGLERSGCGLLVLYKSREGGNGPNESVDLGNR